jgi:hypothetical protein
MAFAMALVAFLVVLAAGLLYWFPLRRLFGRWGTTAEERARAMPADDAVPAPGYRTTLAITIDAPPEAIWPWLVQMGYQRGGLYSYDGLDRLFGYLDRPSATRILPEFQHLAVGDVIPIGRGGGFPVSMIDPGRALVLGGKTDTFAWAWQLVLYPIDTRRTRLVSRNRGHLPDTIGSWFILRVLEPTAFLMTRRMLIGIKQRAEALAATGKAAA